MHFKLYIKINIFVLMLIITSLVCKAAIVSDNDGSAFVTKAEFEALKNDFDAQINNYNKSIDNKVDGAIASYLAGIKTAKVVELESLINKVNSQSSYTSGWFPMCKTFNFSSTNKPTNGQLALQLVMAGGMGKTSNGYKNAMAYSLNIHSSDGYVRDRLVYVDQPSTKTNGKYYCIEKSNDKSFAIYQGDSLEVSYKETLVGVRFGWSEAWGVANQAMPLWGVETLKNDSGMWTPIYAEGIATWSVAYSPSGETSYSTYVPAYFIPTYELSNTNQIWPIMGSCPTTKDTICLYLDNFSMSTPSDVKSTIRCGYKGNVLGFNGETMVAWPVSNGQHSSTDLNWYYNYHPLETLAISDIAVKEVSSVMSNKKYEFYRGLPICSIDNNGTLTMNLKFHSESGNKIHWAIKSNTFDNDSIYTNDPSLNLRLSDDSVITSQEVDDGSTLSIKCDVRKDSILWIKAYDANDNTKYVGVESVSIVEETD